MNIVDLKHIFHSFEGKRGVIYHIQICQLYIYISASADIQKQIHFCPICCIVNLDLGSCLDKKNTYSRHCLIGTPSHPKYLL